MADSAYCTRRELALWGTTAAALQDIEPDDQDNAIMGASSVIDGYLKSHLNLPLVSWDRDIRRACAVIAAYDLIAASVGRNPEESGDNDPLENRYARIMKWLEQVGEGLVITSAIGSTVAVDEPQGLGAATVSSNFQRGGQDDLGVNLGGTFTGRRR